MPAEVEIPAPVITITFLGFSVLINSATPSIVKFRSLRLVHAGGPLLSDIYAVKPKFTFKHSPTTACRAELKLSTNLLKTSGNLEQVSPRVCGVLSFLSSDSLALGWSSCFGSFGFRCLDPSLDILKWVRLARLPKQQSIHMLI